MKKFAPVIIIGIFSLAGLSALIHPGLYTAHDIWHNVARLYHYQQAVSDGQFPPAWIGTLAQGYGYPLFIFSYHLPWLIALPFLSAGLSIPSVLKLLFFLSFFLSGLSMFSLARHLTRSRKAAVLASILYLWAPYRFYIIFVSASMGSAWVFVFAPLLLLGFYLTSIPLIAFALAGIILSHFIGLFTFLPVVALFFLWLLFSFPSPLRLIKSGVYGILLGLCLAAFYLIPAVRYSPLTISRDSTKGFSQIYTNNFVYLKQLIYSPWGYGPVSHTAKDGEVSFQIGIAHWGSVILLTLLLTIRRTRHSRLLSLGLILSFLISVIAMLDVSRPWWDLAQKILVLDYPTRFLSPALFISSLSAGVAFLLSPAKLRLPLLSLLIVLTLYANRNHLRVNLYSDEPVATYFTSELTTNTHHEYFPLSADARLLDQPSPPTEPYLYLSQFMQSTDTFFFSAATSSASVVSLRQVDFPGQTLYLDGRKINYSPDTRGRISLNLPVGTHYVYVRYYPTFLMQLSRLISLVSLAIVLYLAGKKIIRQNRTHNGYV
ncbi:hypothetical protein A2701_01155 [Candidatus Amesbacteria bacterium RIFCSPHIGHO2_01_FULL_47_34]|uniref:Membrane protein 6-pyruvoyl-tetrahydropterin synthase-related domain-containing protein n=4 Tax=Candidatus Amesiibacteriota TaxID=1752730 RepID=A0A1F4ZTJ8_9BACT|nr:MAG: hypothetical protein UX86_C0011G0036 [Candidatus Amesbacteria bacterium GW2011_GWC1_47_15]KKU98406.1 MAG: hypothetical protein UY28_C0002G0011 [Candidatus Amesbacteria bacterium GW2011_GWB1_48_13]OGC98316.1 MAG: hypothetical protein A2701_01155 [Candidatus Amesbacteria bacterium RIFCSPHIGHO2_01_FULL_47_34]OGD00501.1 MAG: hypothetical protein A2972_03330 [Candidatus Amesbacteria bacterium RIFCSPLOWO2_01_FULL_47_33]OGD08777.1 MAG: hypothetical protein A2395_02850 [Candidatus Amesbacteria 